MIDISVIVPVYNVEEYVEKCIQSIINQTFKNIEIILINDASTDNSYEIIKKYIGYDNIIIINNERNIGLSETRNKGIRIARGKYVSFIDSDDFIEKDFLYFLYKSINETNSDICVSSIIHWYCEDGKSKYINKMLYDDLHTIDNETAIRDFLLRKNIYNYACNKLYKRDLFLNNNIYFPKDRCYEDAYTMYKLLYNSNKICFSKKVTYFYVQRPGSIMKQSFSQKDMDYIWAVDELEKFLKENNLFNKLQQEYYAYYSNSYCSRLKKIFLSKKVKKEKENLYYLIDSLSKNYKNISKNKYIKFKYKILCLVCRIISR